ncbi:F0F1 ATP synthase subunit A [Deferrisoma palaeochoriense]
MDEILSVPQWTIWIQGRPVVLNAATLAMSWVVMALLLALAVYAARRPYLVPSPFQAAVETVVEAFRDLVNESLGKLGPRYFAFIASLFLFILVSNWIGVVPLLQEPTRDLNTTLALGLLGFVVAHATALRVKGLRAYVKEYFQPFFFMFPLNVIGEAAKVVSISFRLYGNIMGGAIIIAVVSRLVHHLILPPFLYAFFGLFVGTVQAFVFAMLTLTYISVAIQE